MHMTGFGTCEQLLQARAHNNTNGKSAYDEKRSAAMLAG
jgi:hypothetical protein